MTTAPWTTVDWSKTTNAIAAERRVSISAVSKARRRYAPHTLAKHEHRAAADMRIPRRDSAAAAAALPTRTCPKCGAVLERKIRANGKLETVSQFEARQTCGQKCKGAAIAAKLTAYHARAAHPQRPAAAPTSQPDLSAEVADLKRRLTIAQRAFATTRTALETAVDERDELTRDAAADREGLRAIRRALAQQSARADRAEAERDQALADLRRAHADLATASTHDTGTAAAERDAALAELDTLKANRAIRPELLTALNRAATAHPDLTAALAGALTDSWAPHAKGGPTAHRGERT